MERGKGQNDGRKSGFHLLIASRNQDAADGATLSVDKFGGGVHDNVGTVLNRIL